MSTNTLKTIARDLLDGLWNQRDMSIADELLAPDHVSYGPYSDDLPAGPEGQKLFVGGMLDAFPDTRCQIDRQEVDGDLVTTWATFTGTNTGPLMGMPPTGKRAVVHVVITDRVEGGQIVESQSEWDPEDMMRQLGH